MRHYYLSLFLCVFLAGTAMSAKAAEPVVSMSWLQNTMASVKVLDVRSDPMAFHKGRIPGAIYTHYGRDGWRVTKAGVPGMRPSNAELESLLGRLGISAEDHVVLVAAGKTMPDMAMATRIYWTLKTLGHEKVSILNGGYRAFLKTGLQPEQGRFTDPPMSAVYKAKPRSDLTARPRAIMMGVRMGDPLLIDNRIPAMFLGLKKSGKVSRAGTLPGAVNVPSPMMLAADMTFKSADDIRSLYQAKGADPEAPAVVFCNSGHYASLGWFVAYEILGNSDVVLYDGSLAAWDKKPSNPIVAGLAANEG